MIVQVIQELFFDNAFRHGRTAQATRNLLSSYVNYTDRRFATYMQRTMIIERKGYIFKAFSGTRWSDVSEYEENEIVFEERNKESCKFDRRIRGGWGYH